MHLIDYSHPNGLFTLTGLLGDPDLSKKKRTSSSLFVNNRYVINDGFFEILKSVYKDFLMIGRFPFFILNLGINSSLVDFNIHPQKMTIRFTKEKILFPYIENAMKVQLEELFLPKKHEVITKPLKIFGEEVKEEALTKYEKNNLHGIKPEIIVDEMANIHIDSSSIDIDKSRELIQTRILSEDNLENKFERKIPPYLSHEQYIITETLPKMRPISRTGQLSNKIYIIFESEDQNSNPGILILDQHAASEWIMKEKFLNQYKTSKIQKQQLISPLKIIISPAEQFFLKEHLIEINNFGFELEEFGGNSFILRAVPAIFEKIPNINILKDMIEEIAEIGKQQSFSDAKEEIVNYLACHKSIRGGDLLILKDIRKLIIELSKCKNPNQCAHGRPTFRFISFKELDKMFKRIA